MPGALIAFGLLTAAIAELFMTAAISIPRDPGPVREPIGTAMLGFAIAIFLGVAANLLIWAGSQRLLPRR